MTGPDEEKNSWATEGLPLSVRKELLERDLKKLGARAAAGTHAAARQDAPPEPDAGRLADASGADHPA